MNSRTLELAPSHPTTNDALIWRSWAVAISRTFTSTLSPASSSVVTSQPKYVLAWS